MAWQTMYPATPGSPYTTLASGIDEDDTSISLTTDPGFAAATNLACIWDDTGNFEVVRYTDLTGTTLTVERAFEGDAQAWSAGAYIANLIPAYAINSLQNNVDILADRGLPSGGTEGQIIKKVDGTNFNVTWGDPIDADALVYKGAINCSTNPNYPAADAGDTYKVSAAGKIGGASGPSVAVGDLIICSVNSTASGDHATVGSHWSVIGATTEGGVAGPTSSIDGNFPAFSGTSGGSIVDSGTGPSSFLQKTLATAANLFLVSSAANTWAVKTIAEIKTLLGLGGAAYLDVGTEAGSVCAGDDSRLSDARTPDSHGNEAHSAAFLTTIDIHGTPAETSIADNDEILIYDTSASANRRMTRANLVAGLSGGGTGGTGISWIEISGTTQTAVVNTGYVPNNESLVTITLPATAALGSIIRVAGFGAGGWAVAQNVGQQIIYGDVTTTEGVSGSLASINRYDAVELLCVVADTKFIVISGIGTVEVA